MKNYADRGGCDRHRARGGRKRPDFNWVFPGLIPRSAYWPGIIPGQLVNGKVICFRSTRFLNRCLICFICSYLLLSLPMGHD